MSQVSTPPESLQKAAHLVHNKFGVGLFLEALAAEGFAPQTDEEVAAVIKMGQEALRDRPFEKAHNAKSAILKAAGVAQAAPAGQPAQYNVDAIVDAALQNYPALGAATLELLTVQG